MKPKPNLQTRKADPQLKTRNPEKPNPNPKARVRNPTSKHPYPKASNSRQHPKSNPETLDPTRVLGWDRQRRL